ncbi:MAG: zinc-binding dehydrogenase [Cyclobacteriaceae bacterium]|nr:zinc-binding dehydrogenase [Cyclobacteriaceae bacterium]
MKAIVLNQKTYQLEVQEVDKPTVLKSDVLIKIKAAALNHHELWTLLEKNLKSESNIIMGSDGAGVVEQVGEGVKDFKIGEEVIINPSLNWGLNNRVHGQKYEILGSPTQGTFSQYISISEQYVHHKPAHLSIHQSAALPLAGLTAYRALFTRGEFEPDNKVLITGIGGGAALFALSFAIASGAEVYVTSSNGNKISRAIELGAKGGVNYKDNNWRTELEGKVDGFDVIIDSAGGEGFVELCELANPGGRIALFGRTAGNIPNISPKTIFWKQLSIHGTTMGNDNEFKKLVGLISSKRINPVIDAVYSAKDINEAFEKMNRGEQFGKIVINMDEL